MLKIETPETELWDEYNQRFILVKKQTLFLEHSLISLSRWESNWEKPFLKRNCNLHIQHDLISLCKL